FGQLGKGLVDIDVVLIPQLEQKTIQRALELRAIHRRTRGDAADGILQGPTRIAKDQIGIKIPGESHAGALRAGSLLAVKRKQSRIQRLVANAAAEAEKTLVENLLATLGDQMNYSITEPQTLIHPRF